LAAAATCARQPLSEILLLLLLDTMALYDVTMHHAYYALHAPHASECPRLRLCCR
jgi:hypothetical protein